jgi:hypothetical protein
MNRSKFKQHIDSILKSKNLIELKIILLIIRNEIKNNRSFMFFFTKNKCVNEKILELYNNVAEIRLSEIVYRIMYDINYIKLCECGNICRYINIDKGYNENCGKHSCIYVNNKRNIGITKTFNEKYGGHPMKTNIETIEKLKNSVNNKYGYDNIMTYLSKENLVKSPFRLDLVKKKIKNTFNEKYGGHPMQNDDVFTNNLKSRVKFKKYKLPSGSEINLQGYENFGIEFLLNKYSEQDILFSVKEINNEIGIIYYDCNNKKCRYYSDFFIKSINKIYEVKSIWTYNANIEKNILKMNRCIELGFDFEFLIFDYKGNLLKL